MAWVPWTVWPCGRYGHFGREKWWGFGGPGLFLGNTDVGWVFEVRSSLEMVRSWETTRWDTPTLGISCSGWHHTIDRYGEWSFVTYYFTMGPGGITSYTALYSYTSHFRVPTGSTGRVLGFWLIAKYSIFTWKKQLWIIGWLTPAPVHFLKSDSKCEDMGMGQSLLYHTVPGITFWVDEHP